MNLLNLLSLPTLACDGPLQGGVHQIIIKMTPIRDHSILVHGLREKLRLARVDLLIDFGIALFPLYSAGKCQHSLELRVVQNRRNSLLRYFLNFARFILVVWTRIWHLLLEYAGHVLRDGL